MVIPLYSNIDALKATLVTGTVIADNTNFNSIMTPGIYCVTSSSSANTMTNMPVKVAGQLKVEPYNQPYGSSTVRMLQKFIRSGSPQRYIRYYTGSWSAWEEENTVPLPGTWSGNQTVASLQTAVVRSGNGTCYLQDTTYGNGWSSVYAQVTGTYVGIMIVNDSKIIFTRTTDRTSWQTHSLNFS